MSQFAILGQRRFAGFFWTQSIGAFTDSFYKQTLIALLAHRQLTFHNFSESTTAMLSGAIFMAPFFFFSATAGQLADKFDKAWLVRRLKLGEVFFSLLAAWAISQQNLDLCMLALVLFALQATFFGPIKYGILPQLLSEAELVTGNAWVETSTNLFILIGTILGTQLVLQGVSDQAIGVLLVAISTVGFLCSRSIPAAPGELDLKVDWNPLVPTWNTLKLVGQQRAILNSILGISWFWALGLLLLTAFPFYATHFLGCSLSVSTCLFVFFSLGVGFGSMWCERLSYGRLELGLVPFGSLGISFFLGLLALLGNPLPQGSGPPLGAGAFLQTPGGLAICASVFFFSVSTGFFIVPLYTLIQQRSDKAVRARVIAGNNIVNAMFMVPAALALGKLQALGVTFPQIFGLLAGVNLLVAVYIYRLIPEFGVRFVAFVVAHLLYRIRVEGEDQLPEEGGLLLAPNHVSFVDWLFVMASVRRPVRFVMWYTFFDLPVVGTLFKMAGVIPISSARVRPKILQQSFVRIREALEAGEIVCIFPEGSITKTGEMNPFRSGIERIVETTPVPVVPVGLRGLWGSNFSRFKGGFWSRFRRRPLRSKIEVVFGEAIAPEQLSAEGLQAQVARLLEGDSAKPGQST